MFADATVENLRTEQEWAGSVRVADGRLVVYDDAGVPVLDVADIIAVWHEGGQRWFAQDADLWRIVRAGGCGCK